MAVGVGLSPYLGTADVLGAELNALGAATGKAVSAALDNGVDLNLWADFELAVDFVAAPVLNAVIELYLLPSIDGGTVFADGGTTVLPSPNLYAGGFPVRATTAAQVMVLRGIPLPPGQYKVLVQNTTTQAFPATGSTLRMNTYRMRSD